MCSYCGCESIAVVGRFMAEHTDIINATGRLSRAAAAGDVELVKEHVAIVEALLHPHASAEELGLFAVLREQPDFTDHVDTLCSEHTMLDALLEDIAGGNLRATTEFVGALRRHIDKEDNGLFPAAAIALDGPEWERVDALTHAQESGRFDAP